MTIIGTTPWIFSNQPNPSARLRLFCFPHAGGGASMFQPWISRFPTDIEICPVQLPGRENRFKEPAFQDFGSLATMLAQGLQPYLTKPFAFFGHSMGAMISFEFARQLRRQHAPLPTHIFASSYRAPQVQGHQPLMHEMSEDEFVRALVQLDSKNREVLENKELRPFVLPILRSDFTACETYRYTEEPPLACPITVTGGVQDQRVSYAELEAWRSQTESKFRLSMFPGGHFYLHSTPEPLLRVVARELMAS